MKLRSKMIVYILTTALLIYFIAVGYISFNLNRISVDNAKRLAQSEAENYANVVKGELEADFVATLSLSKFLAIYKDLPRSVWEPLLLSVHRELLVSNPDFLSVATSYEYYAIDTTYKKDYGRLQHGYFRAGPVITQIQKEKNMEGDDIGSKYYYAKSNKATLLLEPYFDSYTGLAQDSMLMSGFAVPVIVNNQFVALAGIDISLQRFEKMVNKIKPFENSYAFLVAHNGTFAGHPNSSLINQPVSKAFPMLGTQAEVIAKILNKEKFSQIIEVSEGEEAFIVFAPVQIEGIEYAWSLGIVVPVSVIRAEANNNMIISALVGLVGMLIMVVIIFYIASNISKPIKRATDVLNRLSNGEIAEDIRMKIKTKDEIGAISNSINILLDAFTRMAQFAKEIGKGNLNVQFEKLSDKDIIGGALIEMQGSIIKSKSEEMYRAEQEHISNWSTQGQAHLAEVLRMNTEDLSKLSFEILKNLVQYIKAEMGVFYVINDEKYNELILEFAASYAIDPDSINEKSIEFGVGLIGRCAQEKETLLLFDIPGDYIKINSGLGQIQPQSILIVPLLFNTEVNGVVEIASFRRISQYEKEFIEKAGASIATTLSKVKTNIRTSKLLLETRIKSEELAAQEELLKQNMLEIMNAQKDAALKTSELSSILDAVNSISFVAEYDMDGRLMSINDTMLKFTGMKREQLIGKFQGQFNVDSVQNSEEHVLFWQDLRAGISKRLIQHVRINEKELWISEAYTPVYNEKGVPYKVLNISVDISDSYKNK